MVHAEQTLRPDVESAFLLHSPELMVKNIAPEAAFDALARQAAAACDSPMALITLVDKGQHRLIGSFGLDALQLPRGQAFCSHTLDADGLFEVGDARNDPRFADETMFADSPHARFFAGSALALAGGERVGALGVIDHQPRTLSDVQSQSLRDLATVASALIEARGACLHAQQRGLGPDADAAEAPFRSIVDGQSELVSLAESSGKLLYVNPAYARRFGRSPQELTGTDLFELIDPQERRAVRAAIDGVLRDKTPRQGENRMIDADGRVRTVAWTNGVYEPVGQQPPLLFSIGRDVTEQRMAERAMRESEAFSQKFARVSGVGGWSLDLASGALTWAEQTRRIHEVAPDFAPTLSRAIDFYAPSSRPLIEAAVQDAIEQGTPWDLELEIDTATGRRIWVRAVGEAEFEDGRAVRLIGTFQDISERRRLESRLIDSERFLRLITDNLPVRIAYLDRERRYRFVNQELAQQLGQPREEIIGRTRDELLGAPGKGELAQRAQAVLQGLPQQFEFEETVGAQTRRIENRLIPDLDDDGEVRGFFVTGIDITESSAAGRAARELATILENTTDFVVQTDREGRISYLNPASRRFLGLGPHESIAQRHFAEFNTPRTNALYADVILPAVKRDDVWVGQTEVYAAGRREVAVSHMVLAHRDADGRVERFSAVMRDITEMVEAQREILRQSATLRSVADAAPAAVAVIDMQGCYRFVNRAFARWWRRPATQIIGLSVRELLGEEEFGRRRAWIDRVRAGETVNFELENPGRKHGVHQAITYIPLRLDDGRADGFVVITQDISDHKREASRLQQLAQRDPLTGLLNRAGFEQALEQARQKGSQGLAVLYIDLDHFKPINDKYGHPVGDQVLTRFGQRLNQIVRPTDVLARLGGDEFAVALPGIRELGHAQMVADKVLAAAHEPFEVDALRLQIGASVGVAWDDEPTGDWRTLVALADAQLLRAKTSGRGRQEAQSPD